MSIKRLNKVDLEVSLRELKNITEHCEMLRDKMKHLEDHDCISTKHKSKKTQML